MLFILVNSLRVSVMSALGSAADDVVVVNCLACCGKNKKANQLS